MSTPKIDASLKAALGLVDDDPGAFVVACFKQATKTLGTLQNRACQRAELTKVNIVDSDPKKAGQQHAVLDLRFAAGDDFGHLAAKFGTLVMRGPAAVNLLIDEGRRMVLGQPVGPKSKAFDYPDGDSVHALDAGADDTISDAAFQLLGRTTPHGIFGIDDALILGIGIPLLCALIPFVLPMLIQLGSTAFQVISSAVTGAGAKPAAPPPPANQIDAFADKIGIGTPGKDDTFKVLIIVAVLVGGVIYLRRKGKLGGA